MADCLFCGDLTCCGGSCLFCSDSSGNGSSSGGSAYILPTASRTTKGGIKIGYGLSMSDDTLNVTISGDTIIGGSSYSLQPATSSRLGGVKVGNGLTITNGILSANAQNYTLPAASDEEISAIIENYFAYSVVGGA